VDREHRVLCGNVASILPAAKTGPPGDFFREVVSGKERVSIRNFSYLSVDLRPFLASLFPGKLAALFTLDPLVLPNIFFNEVCDPEEWIGIQYGRDLYVFFSL
jgi:hypothetical protein